MDRTEAGSEVEVVRVVCFHMPVRPTSGREKRSGTNSGGMYFAYWSVMSFTFAP